MRTDDELKSFLVNKNYKTHYNSLFNKLSIEEQEYIISKYPDSININEVIYRFLNDIDIRPVCKNCGGFIKSFRADRGFGNFCSKSCASEYNNKMRNSIKYLHDGMYNKYGVDNPLKIQEIKDKIKITNIKKYGVECTLQNKEVRNKIKQTLKEKYGVEYSPLAIKGMEDGSFKKYGTKYPAQSNLYWENYNFEKAKIKEYETKRKNNSFNKSKPEDICYNLLKEKYPDIIRQYSSKEYPFNCDFYIAALKLYIEYNGSHYHHYHPFNENSIEDINELNKLKKLELEKLNKNKRTQYSIIIYTWTDLDVRKRNIAKKNNLNWIEFFTLNDVKEWIKNQ